ncbi:hypothetical protein ACF09C_07795 [Streptomyces sp. NPDC014870]|uniref:hypothetical protein n=1 Tax=Streptomyces sp. NPDC014870 TaxID=3364925 RepID=UPI0036F6413D
MDRRTTLVLLTALLTSGCVAVPPPAAPSPPARGGEVSPAAVRPPSPLPEWPAPREAEPRETLAATEPEAGAEAEAGAAPAAGAGPERYRATGKGKRKASVPAASSRPTVAPARPRRQPKKPTKPAKPARTESPTGLRALCRQAEGSGAVPSGVVDLCRRTYGR